MENDLSREIKMRWKNLRFKYVYICIFITFIVSCIISIAPINVESCKCSTNEQTSRPSSQHRNVARGKLIAKVHKHRLAVLVPFRERFEELLQFAPYMQKFLDKQNIDYRIFILNQVDKFRFNRASLMNAGFHHVQKNYDYIAMHDVDLLPQNDQLLYSYPEKAPLHISSPQLHPRYHYPTFVGGILLINREHYTLVNGMSNKYWGWGLEDDEFYVRLKEASLKVVRPQNISTGTHNTFKHIHDRNHRKRDMAKCYNQRQVTRKRDRETGLNNVSYKLVDNVEVVISGAPVTVLGISLACNKTLTPWCECDKVEPPKDIKKKFESNKTEA